MLHIYIPYTPMARLEGELAEAATETSSVRKRASHQEVGSYLDVYSNGMPVLVFTQMCTSHTDVHIRHVL